jgi:uncharacterized protein
VKHASKILSQTAHRPWPLPAGPWIMEQGWYDLLFAHWEVPFETLRSLVPRILELDTYSGRPWVSVAAFLLKMRPRGLSAMCSNWSFPELNFRTYVLHNGKPGVYFFSLDAASLPAVLGANMFYRLPYFHARMTIVRDGPAIRFRGARIRSGATFSASYQATTAEFQAAPGTLSHWLTERYCLYSVDTQRVYVGEVHHAPWLLQNAHVEIAENTLAEARGISVNDKPDLVQFAAAQEVLIWPLRPA